MKSFVALAFTLLVAVAQAVIFTNSAFDVVPGRTFTLTWSGASGPVTIKLKNGPNSNLKDVMVVTSGATGTSFAWAVPASLPTDKYAFEIVDGTGVPNYSLQFDVEGTSSPSTSAASTASATSASSSASSSASTTATARSASTSGTLTTSATRTSASQTAATNTTVPGAAGRLASPLALILVTIAAMVYFH